MNSQAQSFRALHHIDRGRPALDSPSRALRAIVLGPLILAVLFATQPCLAADVLIATADPVTPQLTANLLKPEGSGPFPAIVLLHDCSGLGPRSSGAPARWAKELV